MKNILRLNRRRKYEVKLRQEWGPVDLRLEEGETFILQYCDPIGLSPAESLEHIFSWKIARPNNARLLIDVCKDLRASLVINKNLDYWW